jgi:hypothetical protein
MGIMHEMDVFQEVYADLRFPLVAADLEKLRHALRQDHQIGQKGHFAVRLSGTPKERRAALVSSLRGLFSRIEVPPAMINLIANSGTMRRAGLSESVRCFAAKRPVVAVFEHSDMLVWEEESFWPVAFSTLLLQFTNVMAFHQKLIEVRIAAIEKELNDTELPTENVEGVVSEFPRQLPTHFLYAMASLGAWLGGAINVQYFGYYAAIRQIYHSDLNIMYAKRIGFSDSDAEALASSGMVAIPATLLAPLVEAQGSKIVFGSIQLDEFNPANMPSLAFMETMNPEDKRSLPGFVIDKFYRAPFLARVPNGYGFYGLKNVLRDHYADFYASLPPHSLLRCKHYCVPIVEIASKEELSSHLAKIPLRSKYGLFFRGQRRLYPLQRHETVRKLLYGESCSKEPSLVTAASREAGYDYDFVHYGLKAFLEEDVLRRADEGESGLFEKWRNEVINPMCSLDYAVVALAQHYGIPSHGLDVTTNLDVALWFATNRYSRDDSGVATYTMLRADDWPTDPEEWPVVIVCQMVTQSIEQSLHGCQELAPFGFDAQRPRVQHARFFQGGHSDHQNRLAEAVVCFFRLSPKAYDTQVTFDALFPLPEHDPAYRVMLRFASSPVFGPECGRFVNRFHA